MPTRPFKKNIATVFIDEQGHQRLMMPSGEVMPMEIKSHVIDNVDGYAQVRVTAFANLVGSQDEALEKYNGVK